MLASFAGEIERSNYAMTTPPCSACHAPLDPFGRVLEGFDAAGGLRSTVDGLPVDATGDFSSAPPLQGQAKGTINGAADFAQAITADQEFAGCAVQQIASYAVGRTLQGTTSCEMRRLSRSFTGSDGTMATLLRQVAVAAFIRARGSAAP
jgi:Protein of unknown function (DUF1585)/Protein of unknown function (DUF1588)